MDTTVAAKVFRLWLACQFALVGFGLLLMVGIASIANIRSSQLPLGLSSTRMLYVLFSVVLAFAAIHVIAFFSILRRSARAHLVAAGTCLLALLVSATGPTIIGRASQVDVAYSTLLGIELILLFVPAVRAEFGPRVKIA
jgi:hypothetical protein